MKPQQLYAAKYIHERIEQLVDHARQLGIVVTVEQKIDPKSPSVVVDHVTTRLARGHYEP